MAGSLKFLCHECTGRITMQVRQRMPTWESKRSALQVIGSLSGVALPQTKHDYVRPACSIHVPNIGWGVADGFAGAMRVICDTAEELIIVRTPKTCYRSNHRCGVGVCVADDLGLTADAARYPTPHWPTADPPPRKP